MQDGKVFAADARIELIDGALFETLVTMKPPHAASVAMLNRLLTMALGDRAFVRCKVPVTLGDFSEPEPDISIVRMPPELYDDRHPRPDDIFALIEVADSSMAPDLSKKLPLYATFAIPETWIVDLVKGCVRVFRQPRNQVYENESVSSRFDEVALALFPDVRLQAAAILGSRSG